jgi:hypothetical protein
MRLKPTRPAAAGPRKELNPEFDSGAAELPGPVGFGKTRAYRGVRSPLLRAFSLNPEMGMSDPTWGQWPQVAGDGERT